MKFLHTDGQAHGPIKGSTRSPPRTKNALLRCFVLREQFFGTPETLSLETTQDLKKSEA